MAVHDARYFVKTSGNRSTPLSLYNACIALMKSEHRSHDFTHIKDEYGAYVAFWCNIDNKIKPSYDADASERDHIKNWFG